MPHHPRVVRLVQPTPSHHFHLYRLYPVESQMVATLSTLGVSAALSGCLVSQGRSRLLLDRPRVNCMARVVGFLGRIYLIFRTLPFPFILLFLRVYLMYDSFELQLRPRMKSALVTLP